MADFGKLQTVCELHEITPMYIDDLFGLRDFDIVIIGDDSGSMRAKASPSKTRWEELKEVMRICVDIGGALDSDGIDILFLNRRGKDGVREYKEVENLFKRGPGGTTPLTAAIKKAIKKKGDKKMLLIIATDGVPNNRGAFNRVLKNRDCDNILVSFLACSNKKSEVGYLDKLDRDVPGIDVLDDFRNEQKQVLKVQGKDFPYKFSDHVARMLLGPVYEKYDKLDEMKWT